LRAKRSNLAPHGIASAACGRLAMTLLAVHAGTLLHERRKCDVKLDALAPRWRRRLTSATPEPSLCRGFIVRGARPAAQWSGGLMLSRTLNVRRGALLSGTVLAGAVLLAALGTPASHCKSFTCT
jgi:hypothetical protein